MNKIPADRARLTDSARLLPIFGLLLLMPPVVTLFVVGTDVGGVPLIVVYLFGVWLSLIAAAAWLARRLAPPPPAPPPERGAAGADARDR